MGCQKDEGEDTFDGEGVEAVVLHCLCQPRVITLGLWYRFGDRNVLLMPFVVVGRG